MRALSNPQSSVKYSHPQESLPDIDLTEEESDVEEGQMPEPSPVSKHSAPLFTIHLTFFPPDILD